MHACRFQSFQDCVVKKQKALYDFIAELEEQRGKELTDKQTKALIKIAKGLISSIKAEMRLGILDTLKKTIMKYIPW